MRCNKSSELENGERRGIQHSTFQERRQERCHNSCVTVLNDRERDFVNERERESIIFLCM
jgi:hypothetical protein